MKYFSSKNLRIALFALGAITLGLFAVPTSAQLVNWEINGHSADCQDAPVMVSALNSAGNTSNTPCWDNVEQAQAGDDIIRVALYFHNNGTASAPNVSTRLSSAPTPGFAYQNYYDFNGEILVAGTVVDYGSARINLPSSPYGWYLEFEEAHIQQQFNNLPSNSQGILLNANLNDFTDNNGWYIGNLQPGWNYQGVTKLSFRLTEAEPITPSCGNVNIQNLVAPYPYGTINESQWGASGTSVPIEFTENSGCDTICNATFQSETGVNIPNQNNVSSGFTIPVNTGTGDVEVSLYCFDVNDTSNNDTANTTPQWVPDTSTSSCNLDVIASPSNFQTSLANNDVQVEWSTVEVGSCGAVTCDMVGTGVNGTSQNDYGIPDLFGGQWNQLLLNIDANDIYTITCTAADGTSASDTVTIGYNGGGNSTCNPTITSFNASPNDIDDSNDDINFTWDTNESNNCNLTCDLEISSDGDTDTVSNVDPTNGSYATDGFDDDVTAVLECYETGNPNNDTSDSETVQFDNGGNSNSFIMDTKNPNDDDGDQTIVLRGEVDDGNNVDVWFVYSRTDSTPECGNGNSNSTNDEFVWVGSSYDTGDSFSEQVSGLDPGTYHYAACGEEGNDLEDGGYEEFTVDSLDDEEEEEEFNINGDVETPRIATLRAEGVSQSAATLVGVYDGNGCSNLSTYIRMGTSPNALTNRSLLTQRGDTEGLHRSQFTGLGANTMYYYQMVGVGCGVTIYGDVKNFRTNALPSIIPPFVNTVPRPTIPFTNTNTTNTTIVSQTIVESSGDSCIDLDITNDADTLSRGEVTTYTIQWTNNCEESLENGYLVIELPRELVFLGSSVGDFTSRSTNAVTVSMDNLVQSESAKMTMTARVRNTAQTQVLTSATISFNGNDGDTVDNTLYSATAFDIDGVDLVSVLTASVFGAGWLTGSVWGWLTLLLALMFVIFAARYFYIAGTHDGRRRGGYGETQGYYAPAPAMMAPAPELAATVTSTYRPYAPKPVGQ